MIKYVKIAFVFMGILTWAIMSQLFEALFDFLNPGLNIVLIGKQFTMNNLLGLCSGIICIIILWKNERVNTLGLEIANELKRVTWPGRQEAKVSTIVVIITSIIVSLILGFFDYIWASITSLIYKF